MAAIMWGFPASSMLKSAHFSSSRQLFDPNVIALFGAQLPFGTDVRFR
jgi:hypothetical protein